MKHKKENITSAEFLAQLHSDPEWIRQDADREIRHKVRVAQLQAELAPEENPLVAELAEKGYVVGSVWDLVNTRSSYLNAIPVLTKYLGLSRHPILRNGIARALSVPEARGVAGRTILDEIKAGKDLPGSEERWALANALTMAADKSMVDEINALIADAGYEDIQERLTAAVRNLRAK